MQALIKTLVAIQNQITAAEALLDIATNASGTVTRQGKPLTPWEIVAQALGNVAEAKATMAEQIEELRQIKTAKAFDRFDEMLQGGEV